MPTYEEQQAALRTQVPTGTPGALELQNQGFSNIGTAPTSTGFTANFTSPISAGDLNKATNSPITPQDTSKLLAQLNVPLNNIFSNLGNYYSSLNEKAAAVNSALQPSAEETATQQKLANLQSNIETAQSNLQARPGIDLFTLGRGQSEITRQNALNVANLQRQLILQQGTRQQKLDAAKFAFDTAKSSLNDTINLFKAVAPDKLSIEKNELTGDITLITRNPLTGEISSQSIGNIGPSKLTESAKNAADLAKQYPDAGILPTDTFEQAQTKVSNSPSFKAKNTNIRATQNPDGSVLLFDAKNNYVGGIKGNQFVPAGGPIPVSTPGTTGTNISNFQPTNSFPPTVKNLGDRVFNTGDFTGVPTRLYAAVGNYIASKMAETKQLFIPGKDRDKLNAYNAAFSTLGQIKTDWDNLSKNLTGAATSSVGQNIPGLSQLLQQSDLGKAVALYKSHRKSYLAAIARAQGEKGVLTDPDIARAYIALPNVYKDTAQTGVNKLSSLSDLFNTTLQQNIGNFAGNTFGGTTSPGTGKIRVKLNNGQTGTIDEKDYNPSSMTKL